MNVVQVVMLQKVIQWVNMANALKHAKIATNVAKCKGFKSMEILGQMIMVQDHILAQDQGMDQDLNHLVLIPSLAAITPDEF